jgi:hypothetical protein
MTVDRPRPAVRCGVVAFRVPRQHYGATVRKDWDASLHHQNHPPERLPLMTYRSRSVTISCSGRPRVAGHIRLLSDEDVDMSPETVWLESGCFPRMSISSLLELPPSGLRQVDGNMQHGGRSLEGIHLWFIPSFGLVQCGCTCWTASTSGTPTAHPDRLPFTDMTTVHSWERGPPMARQRP